MRKLERCSIRGRTEDERERQHPVPHENVQERLAAEWRGAASRLEVFADGEGEEDCFEHHRRDPIHTHPNIKH